jgi:hypothetical protein
VEAPADFAAPSERWARLREGAAGAVRFALYEFAGAPGGGTPQEASP